MTMAGPLPDPRRWELGILDCGSPTHEHLHSFHFNSEQWSLFVLGGHCNIRSSCHGHCTEGYIVIMRVMDITSC